MEFRLSIQILNATQVLEAVKNVPQKKISNKRKAEIENNFNKEFKGKTFSSIADEDSDIFH